MAIFYSVRPTRFVLTLYRNCVTKVPMKKIPNLSLKIKSHCKKTTRKRNIESIASQLVAKRNETLMMKTCIYQWYDLSLKSHVLHTVGIVEFLDKRLLQCCLKNHNWCRSSGDCRCWPLSRCWPTACCWALRCCNIRIDENRQRLAGTLPSIVNGKKCFALRFSFYSRMTSMESGSRVRLKVLLGFVTACINTSATTSSAGIGSGDSVLLKTSSTSTWVFPICGLVWKI